jgi:hypothetical protein
MLLETMIFIVVKNISLYEYNSVMQFLSNMLTDYSSKDI